LRRRRRGCPLIVARTANHSPRRSLASGVT
jgi:hypothetical protein